MNHAELVQLLLRRGDAALQPCHRISSSRFVPETAWNDLKRHEQEYLRCYATALSAHRSVLVGRSAARVTGLWVIPAEEELVELAARGRNVPSKSQWPEGAVYRHGAIPDMDIRAFDALNGSGRERPLLVTTPARSAVDIARWHGLHHGVVALDSLLRDHNWHQAQALRAQVETVLGRLAGKRGIDDAREALRLATSLSDSPFESLMRTLLHQRGIEVLQQMWIGRDYRVDLLWGTLVIEIDGYIKYEDKPHAALMEQLKREDWIKEQGYTVIRLYPVDILRDPEQCIQRVLAKKQDADARPTVRVEATHSRPRGGGRER